MVKMKALAKRLFRSFGYELVTADTAREYLLAGNLRELCRRFQIGLVLDVGANEGQYYDFLRGQVMYSGPVVSFEPVPSLARALADRSRRDRRWEIRQTALGSGKGTGQFNVAGSSQVSSFLAFSDNARHIPVVAVETVAIDTLNDLGPELFRDVPPERTFLKLDTQGYDLEVLKGASDYVDRLPFLTTEVPFIHIYENMPGYEDYFAYFRERKFGLVGMWSTSRDPLFRAREFDCVFVNTRLARQTLSS
jgi:FkbM family methyltransferase